MHTKPVSQKRVLAGTLLLIGGGFLFFTGLSALTRDENPLTITKEWKVAQAKRHRERQMAPITNHKKGQAVTVYEPSIVEGQD